MSRGSPARPLALTPGDPAGIGPDLAVGLAGLDLEPPLVVVADPGLLAARAQDLGADVRIETWRRGDPAPAARGLLHVLPVPGGAGAIAGRADPAHAGYVLATLRAAADGCMSGDFSGLVTGPVSKAVINASGVPFSGHTEFLAERAGAPCPVMMLAAPGLRVALATTHLPLARVSAAITRERLEAVIRVLVRDLAERFGVDRPRVLVCGLNPHAGEGGHLGREEIEVIGPVIESLTAAGLRLVGPLPADTAFTPPRLAAADAVLAMYHDQGLPVLKYAGFGEAVNITLGLPFVRTSVDHGTAFDIAGTGRAEIGSLVEAIRSAAALAGAQS